MPKTFRVHVVEYSSTPNWMMRYTDPDTGKQVAKSSRTQDYDEAVKLANKWEADLEAGRTAEESKATGKIDPIRWGDFREQFFDDHLAELRPRSADSYEVALNAFTRLCNPKWLSDATTQKVTKFRTALRNDGVKPTTVANYLRHLAAATKWAVENKLLAEAPVCKPPKTAKKQSRLKRMKGRPITAAEFDEMLEAVADAVKPEKVEAWRFYLRVLWFSGLRLSESLTLTWDDDPDGISIDLGARVLHIPADIDKAGEERRWQMPPDLVELLKTVPKADRDGRVFHELPSHPVNVSAVGSKIGKAAKVIVSRKGEKQKFASAHDLRRAFGTRWAKHPKMNSFKLKELMRHADITTTEKYYLDLGEADDLADVFATA